VLNVSWLESISSVWLQVAIAGTWVGGVLLLAAIVNRYLSADSEILRKVVHIGTGNVILLAWWLDIPAWVGISASILASTVALVSYKFPILPNINSIGRQSLGTFFYAVSIGLLIAWFWTIQQPHYAVLGILVMTWGDGLAALIGQRFGKHPYTLWGMKKSWEGTLTMAIVSYIVSSLIFLGVQGNVWQTWVVAIAVALVASSLEAFSKFGIDNLTVPLGSAALGFVLNQLFPLG
jgi:phytol kinase